MFSTIKSTLHYLKFYIQAANSKGHGTHSPFVYDFIINVLNDERRFYCFNEIEKYRHSLLKQHHFQRSFINTLNKPKIDTLLFKIINYCGCSNIVEIGSKSIIQTLYIANANINATVVGVYNTKKAAFHFIPSIALNTLQNVQLVDEFECKITPQDSFDLIIINTLEDIDLIDKIIDCMASKSMLIFNSIHNNNTINTAWQSAKKNAAITATIDLYYLQIAIKNTDIKVKQDFKIRF